MGFEVEDDQGRRFVGRGPRDDPWKGFARNQAVVGVYGLRCRSIKVDKAFRLAGHCRVDVEVVRTESAKARWYTEFLLHPTFPVDDRVLEAEPKGHGKIAKEYFWAYGPFVLGAVVFEDEEEVARLELDLSSLRGTDADKAPQSWWEED